MRKTEFDTKLIIYRARQIFILVNVILAFVIFTLMILANQKAGLQWYTVAVPITGVGLLFLTIPKTEEWQYKPWQSKPRQIEQQER